MYQTWISLEGIVVNEIIQTEKKQVLHGITRMWNL